MPSDGRAPYRATVVVPLHNHAEWIGPLLRSLFAQWRPDVSLLVIDDASADGSFAAAMAALEERPDITATVLRNEHAVHNGLAAQVVGLTPSEIIIKADSDDVALPGRLDAVLAAFDADPSCRLVSSNAVLLSAEGIPAGVFNPDEPDSVVDDPAWWAGLGGSRLWLGATMAFHRSVLTEFPPLDPELCPYGLDIVLAFRATLLGTHRYIARPLVGWRQHGRNTHRVAGVLDPRLAARERYEALYLMALAQRVRDAKHARDAGLNPARADHVVTRCQSTVLDRFDDWCRLRARLAAAGPDGPGCEPPPRVAPIPAVVTAGPGRHVFGLAGRLGAAAATWGGFHAPEAGHTWTSGVAALLMLRTSPEVDRLRLTLGPHPWEGRPTAHISVNLGPRTEVVMSGTRPIVAEVPVGDRWGADGVVLLIETTNAVCLQDVDPETTDIRTFGLMLLSLELAGPGADAEAGG